MVFDVDWGRYKLVDLTRIVAAGAGADCEIRTSRGQFPNGLLFHEVTSAHTHAGTHVELPGHFAEDGKTLDEFPLAAFMGRGVLATVSTTDGARVTADVLEDSIGAPVRRDDVLVIRNCSDAACDSDTPAVFTVDAAHWMLGMGIKMLVFDRFRMGETVPEEREFHDILLGRDIPIIHSATHLEKLTRPEFFVIAWPARVHNLDSLWVRVAAIVER